MDDHFKELHHTLFPEEYDFIYDSISDAYRRRKGINPMSTEYQEEVDNRRLAMGVEPYVVPKLRKLPPFEKNEQQTETNSLISSDEYCRQYLLKNKP
ncbi:hypothetical protein [Shewanella sp. SW24]|uniref:hypothetical protein n=1 Tax=Shewanella sp. SW24 TaxID=2912815 RepID=UPI0021DA3ECF|nr:hypothetical protein [Shewanella sp. SW24]MCU7985589.1 hypothetical protein [Shewanella sp. SW24]